MSGFKKFLLRGNVVDLAVAVVIGAAFSAVVNAFAVAFITPLVSLVSGVAGDVSRKSFRISGKLFPYGTFIQALLAFVLTAAVVYFVIVRPINGLLERFTTEPKEAPTTKECPECLSDIPVGALRCAFCTVEQPAPA